MADYSPALGGIAGNYAAADFPDAEDTLPSSAVIDITGHGISAPYGTAVSNVLLSQLEEIRANSAAAVSLPSGWKKRIREFLGAQNTQLLDFLKVSVPSHPTFGKAELLLRRFGNPSVTPKHASVKDFVLDTSGATRAALDALEQRLAASHESEEGEMHENIRRYSTTMRILFEEYRAAGEALLHADGELRQKLERLDKLQSRLSSLFDMDPANPGYTGLMEASESYLREAYKKNQIEEDYTALIAAYRRFIAVKGLVEMSRTVTSAETEPLCTICLQDSVMFALVPCGHTFCQGCSRKQMSTCYVCRGSVKNTVRLYFG